MVGLIYFSVIGVNEKYNLVKELTSLHDMTELSIRISALVHETQKERGATAGYLGSNGENFVTELNAQQKNTDKKVAEFDAFFTKFDLSNFDQSL